MRRAPKDQTAVATLDDIGVETTLAAARSALARGPRLTQLQLFVTVFCAQTRLSSHTVSHNQRKLVSH